LIGNRLPWTLALVGSALFTAALGGTLLGLVAAWRGGRLDGALTSGASVVEALPEFLIGMALLLMFAVAIPLFPLSGGRTLFATGPPDLLDIAWHLALPYVTLVLGSFAAFVLVARGASRAVGRATFVTTARAKGLTERQILFKHVVPNALAPIWTMFGLRLGAVVGGAILVERVFGVPGVGLLSFEAVQTRDYPVLQAVFLLTGLAVIAMTFLVEMSYRVLLPHAHARH
jgi:peptide/nickel transport system permease protein